MRILVGTLLVGLLLGAFANPLHGTDDDRDIIVLKSGKKLRGRIVAETEKTLELQVGSVRRSIPRSSIESFTSVRLSLGEILDRFASQGDETSEMLLELALDCEKASLPEMRELFLYRVLLVDPENETAHEKLGHRKVNDKWMARLGSRVVPWEDHDRIRTEWGRAWELSSEHATVRCNAGLRITTDSLLEVEYLLHTFRHLYGADFDFSDLLQRLEIQIYSDRRSFPSRGSHAGAYFDNKEAVAYTYVESEKPHQLLRVSTVGIFYLLFEKVAGSRGKFPVWVKESWADHMENILVRERPGRPTLQPDRKSDDLFRVVATARNPFSITRILNFEEADYLASSHQDLKYGQGYALFHFLMHQDAYRAKFFEYLQEATEGQGQSSTFNRIFKNDLEMIERAHLQYTR